MEKEIVLSLTLPLAEQLQTNYECQVKLSRDSDVEVSLQDRVDSANAWDADLFLSVHVNGHSEQDANGYEDFTHPEAPQKTIDIRKIIHTYISQVWTDAGRRNRGMKTADFQVLRETNMSAVLLEHGFITNSKDAELLQDATFREKLVDAMAMSIAEAMNLNEKVTGTPIAGQSQATIAQAQIWAKSRQATDDFISLAPIYWQEAPRRGIRADVAYAQSAKETAFGRFGGTVTRAHNNWCGLKTRQGGANSDPNAHARFPDDRTGIIAHIQHLCAYAGIELDETIVDPRYVWVKKGSAITVETLGGKWAPSPVYGISIRDDYLKPMLEIHEPEIAKLKREIELLREQLAEVEAHRDMLLNKIERAKTILGEVS